MAKNSRPILILVLIGVCDAPPRSRGERDVVEGVGNQRTRWKAIKELGDGLDAAPAVPQLVQLLDAPDEATRGSGRYLGGHRQGCDGGNSKAYRVAGEGDCPGSHGMQATDVGVHAASALGKKMGRRGGGPDPLPGKATFGRAIHAACALWEIGPDREAAVTALIGHAEDRDWLVLSARRGAG